MSKVYLALRIRVLHLNKRNMTYTITTIYRVRTICRSVHALNNMDVSSKRLNGDMFVIPGGHQVFTIVRVNILVCGTCPRFMRA